MCLCHSCRLQNHLRLSRVASLQPGWEGSLGENAYMYMNGWVPSLSTRNCHNIVSRLYPNTKQFLFLNFNWRLITLQYGSGFCHTLTWVSHGCTCVPHPEPPPTSHPIPSLWVIPVHQPWAPCLMHQSWTGDLFHIWEYTCFNASFKKQNKNK